MIFNGRNRVRYNYSRFGWTRNGGKTWHGGIDIEGIDDATIRMPFYKGKTISGTVTRSRIVTDKSNRTWEWGYYVCVQLDANQTPDVVNFLYFCHNEKNLVQVGQKVKSGDALAIMGNSGNAALANPPFKHCHFEVRKTATSQGLDPTAYAEIPNEVGTYGSAPANNPDNAKPQTQLPVDCIDVSKHQGVIDWNKVKQSGIRYAILRAGYGMYSNQKDQQFDRNYSECKRLGINVGAYWYSYATSTSEVSKEADVFLSVIKGKQFELPVYYDIEYEPGILALSNSVRTQLVKTFLGKMESAGYYGGLYASANFIKTKLNYNDLKSYDVWCAQYADKCTCVLPYGAWQYTSSGKVNGISGNVDKDYLYKDYPTIIKNAKLNGFSGNTPVTPAPTPTKTLQVATVGPVSAGDAMTFWNKAKELEIGYSSAYTDASKTLQVLTIGPMSNGDAMVIMNLAKSLSVPYKSVYVSG